MSESNIIPGDLVEVTSPRLFYERLEMFSKTNSLMNAILVPQNVSLTIRQQLGLVLTVYDEFVFLILEDGQRGWFFTCNTYLCHRFLA